MTVSFPSVEDIPLGDPPLDEVICQVRFPLDLRLLEEVPTQFQNRLRDRFPILEVERPLELEKDAARAGAAVDFRPPVYRFFDSTRENTVSLSADFFALSTKTYGSWPAFASDLRLTHTAVKEIYGLSVASRIGLRYVNLIGPRFAPDGAVDSLFDLLRPELTTMFRTEVLPSPLLVMNQVRVMANLEDKFAFRYGLSHRDGTDERVVVLDFDHYAEGDITTEGLVERCERYHETIYRAFRWCFKGVEQLSIFAPQQHGC